MLKDSDGRLSVRVRRFFQVKGGSLEESGRRRDLIVIVHNPGQATVIQRGRDVSGLR